MKILKIRVKIIKNTINNRFQPKTTTNQLLLHVFILSVIQFDKTFYLMVLYENYLIRVFIKFNENLKNGGKTFDKQVSQGVIRP